jgi:hypothetical protein
MEWTIWWLIALLLYFLIVKIGRGGNWSDLFDGEINGRNYHWWIDFKLKAFLILLCIIILGGGAWLLFGSMK